MKTLTLSTIGNSVGVILPKEELERLKIGKGDKLCLTETSDGLLLTAYDPDFERQMRLADGVMRRYRNALRELAK
ncbi:MAG: AbrB/MazE/SpoVT family DNA-binding domain-containing protein [Alphaproteobacteria bacterium]|nr:AbrB/MazE/SpoVT family DNA-binding domain-containing protein [Alphaproteobacteria bacterium]MDE2336484.1 AbrB/MazE/SpoVT family DNA-binding domain-containing protein [Alphaproteobacteria bacterium]